MGEAEVEEVALPIVSLWFLRHRYCMKRSRDASRCTTRSVNTMSVPTVLLSHLSGVKVDLHTVPLHGTAGSFYLSSRMMQRPWCRCSAGPMRAATWQRRSDLVA